MILDRYGRIVGENRPSFNLTVQDPQKGGETIQELTELVNLTEEELDRVRAFFITLDPEHDTADRLERYTGYFHTHIIGLRGEAAAIDAVTDAYGVSYSRSPMPDSALGYSISHPTDVFLIDGEGRVVETIPHDARSDYFLARIRRLLDAPE